MNDFSYVLPNVIYNKPFMKYLLCAILINCRKIIKCVETTNRLWNNYYVIFFLFKTYFLIPENYTFLHRRFILVNDEYYTCMIKTIFIFQGVYIATGFDTSNFEKLNYIPKTFAYGTYKIRSVLKDIKTKVTVAWL